MLSIMLIFPVLELHEATILRNKQGKPNSMNEVYSLRVKHIIFEENRNFIIFVFILIIHI